MFASQSSLGLEVVPQFASSPSLKMLYDLVNTAKLYVGGLRKTRGLKTARSVATERESNVDYSGFDWAITKVNVYISELCHLIKALSQQFRNKFLKKSRKTFTYKMLKTFFAQFTTIVDEIEYAFNRTGSFNNFR